MMPNILPEISREDANVLQAFAKSGQDASIVLKRVLQSYLEYFRDIRNVDLMKDNIGLQTCSHLRAYDMLEQILDQISLFERASEEKRSKSFR